MSSKYYIAWKPQSPDVKYWDWFQPDGILLSFSKLKGLLLKRILARGIHEYLGFHGEVFMDGGAYGYPGYVPPYTQRQILAFQTWIRPNKISHLDHPFVGARALADNVKWNLLRSTIENARTATQWEDERDRDCVVVYTIQGWNFESAALCTKKLAKLKRDNYALGSLIGVHPREVVRRIICARQILGKEPSLHLFGTSTPKVLNKVRHLVDSFDSAAPAIAAVCKEVVTPFLRRAHIDAEKFKKQSDCPCPACKRNELAIQMKGLSQQSERFNFSRAVHNAYFYTQYAHAGPA